MSQLPRYENYKDSGVQWLGEIPSHWKCLSIKRLTLVKRGASPRPIDNPEYFDDEGEYAWVRIADVTASDKYLLETTQRLSELGSSLSVKMQPDSIFLSIAGSVGKPIITKVKACIHDGFVYFPDWKESINFLYYIFASGQPYLGLGKLGTQLNLNTDTVGNIKIALPPSDEQKAIVDFLDKRLAQVDALIAKQETLLEKLAEQRVALISHAVTKGLNPDVEMKDSGVQWLGEIPSHWKCLSIKRLTLVKRGASPRPIENPEYFDDEGEYAWVRIADVTASDKYLLETTQRLSELGNSLSVKMQPDSIFLSIAGSVGKPIITKIKACIHDGFVYFPDWKQSVEFLYYIFLSEQPYKGLGKLGTQLNLNTDTVGNIKIALPPFSEQIEIVKYLNNELEKYADLEKAYSRTVEMLKEYRSTLITQVVTGKIDVRNLKLN